MQRALARYSLRLPAGHLEKKPSSSRKSAVGGLAVFGGGLSVSGGGLSVSSGGLFVFVGFCLFPVGFCLFLVGGL